MGKLSIAEDTLPHIAVCPSAGMAHLLPFLRVSSMLSSFNCKVTLMTIRPTLSTAETVQVSSFLASNPHISALDTQLPSLENQISDNHNVVNASTTTHPAASPDPFFLRYVAISNSAHLLACHLIDLSPPPTAILCDIMFVSGFHLALGHLGIPIYVLPITSSRFFAFATFFSHLDTPINNVDDTELVIASSMAPVAKSSIPPPFFNPNHIFTKLIVSNSSWLHKCKGIVSYSFDYLEKETLSALREGDALSYLPPIFTIGPLKPLYDTNTTMGGGDGCDKPSYLAWLDDHPSKSVLYVNFGSRTAMTKEQIRELGDGLDMGGVTFLWVIKTTVVDNQEKENLKDLLGEAFLEKITKVGKGLVLKQWVDQDRILVHPAVGGFMTHCGWNSITETAKSGLPVLGWPLHGDQRVNAEVVETAGLGVWARGWGWIRERLVTKEEISNKIKEVMMNKELRKSAKRVGEEASKAWEADNGTSRLMMSKLIQHMSSKNV